MGCQFCLAPDLPSLKVAFFQPQYSPVDGDDPCVTSNLLMPWDRVASRPKLRAFANHIAASKWIPASGYALYALCPSYLQSEAKALSTSLSEIYIPIKPTPIPRQTRTTSQRGVAGVTRTPGPTELCRHLEISPSQAP